MCLLISNLRLQPGKFNNHTLRKMVNIAADRQRGNSFIGIQLVTPFTKVFLPALRLQSHRKGLGYFVTIAFPGISGICNCIIINALL